MNEFERLERELRGEPAKWLVTGAAGFIGSSLVEHLLSLGQSVVGLDNYSTGHKHNVEAVREAAGVAADNFEMIEGDICNPDDCKRATDGVRYVLHQAALGSVPRSIEKPLDTHRANVDGFVNILIAARDAGVDRFVYASSSSVYGDHPALPKVEPQIGRPLSPYAVSKRINELYADAFALAYGVECVGLRYFNVFGPRQDPAGVYAAVIPKWLDLLFSNKDCVIFGDGGTSRDFCFIANVIQANLLAAARTAGPAGVGRVYNVGCGGNMTLVQLFGALRDGIGRAIPDVANRVAVHQPERAGDVRHSQADVSALTDALGYLPSHDVSAGIAETVSWFAARRKV